MTQQFHFWIQSIFVTHTYAFANLPSCKYLCVTPKSTLAAFLPSFMNIHGRAKSLNHLMCIIPDEIEQDNALSSCFTSYTINKCSFHGLFSATYFGLMCFLLVISLPKMTPKGNAEGLPSVLKYKIMVYFTEEIHVLNKLHTSMINSDVGCEFHVN